MWHWSAVLLLLLPTRESLALGTGGSATTYSTSRLEQYHGNKSAISVSGISSGGAMAVQFHVAFSASVMGLGVVAGVPYHCSQGSLGTALSDCMSSPAGIKVSTLVQAAQSRASSGKIDALVHLRNSRVFIYAGSADSLVNPKVADKIEEFYYDVQATTFKKILDGAHHTFPTLNFGTACSVSETPYIGKCNYFGAYHILNYVYGDIKEPVGQVQLAGKFVQFDQAEFIASTKRKRFLLVDAVNNYVKAVLKGWGGGGSLPSLPGLGGSLPGIGGGLTSNHHGLDIVGFAYIPSGCLDRSRACKIHVVFHGCKQGRESLGDVFARHTGYNEVAELNNVIMLYPQIVADMVGGNPNGCWDWWGYDNTEFDTKLGPQMKAVKSMIDRLSG